MSDAADFYSEAGGLRMPPKSIEAEQSVLGGMMIENLAFDRCGDILTEADFFDQRHRVIFRAMAGMINSCKPADVLTVYEELARGGLTTAHDIDHSYLNALAQCVPSASNIRRYAEIVRENAMLRKLIAASDETATAAFNPQGVSVPDLLDQAATRFTDLQAGTARKAPVGMDKLMVQRIDYWNEVHEGSKEVETWPTGLKDFDDALNGGLQPGRVYVVAARPSVGKSSLVQAIQIFLALNYGIGCAMLSQEMPATECADRATANVGGVDYKHIQLAKFDDMEWGFLSEAVEKLGKSTFFIDEEAGLTFTMFRAKVVSLRRDGVRVVALDYLQLCDFEVKKGQTLDQAIGEFTRKTKKMAKDLKVAIVLISQLSRDVDKRGGHQRPHMGDLRDSGNIEADADVIILLYLVRTFSTHKIVGAHFGKNRQGEFRGDIPLEFQGKYQRWLDSEADITPDKPSGASSKKGISE